MPQSTYRVTITIRKIHREFLIEAGNEEDAMAKYNGLRARMNGGKLKGSSIKAERVNPMPTQPLPYWNVPDSD